MQHIDNWQLMSLPNLEIHCVVRWGNFQNTSAEFRVDRFVGNDRNFLAGERAPRVLAQEISVSFVARMKSHRSVGHDRFRSGSCNLQETPGFFHNFVANKIETSLLWLGNHLFI